MHGSHSDCLAQQANVSLCPIAVKGQRDDFLEHEFRLSPCFLIKHRGISLLIFPGKLNA